MDEKYHISTYLGADPKFNDMPLSSIRNHLLLYVHIQNRLLVVLVVASSGSLWFN